jgi:hypothetical protein
VDITRSVMSTMVGITLRMMNQDRLAMADVERKDLN